MLGSCPGTTAQLSAACVSQWAVLGVGGQPRDRATWCMKPLIRMTTFGSLEVLLGKVQAIVQQPTAGSDRRAAPRDQQSHPW